MITVLIRKFKAFFIRNLSKQKIISSSSFSLSVSQRKPLTPESLEGLESQSLEKPGMVVKDCDGPSDALDSDGHHKPLISVREREKYVKQNVTLF